MSNRENPNQWFLDICPDQWHHKDYFIENTLFAALIHYWESEDGEKDLRHQIDAAYEEDVYDSIEQYQMRTRRYQKVYDALRKAYEFAKNLQEMDIEQSSSDKTSKEMTTHLTSIVKYRGFMWT